MRRIRLSFFVMFLPLLVLSAHGQVSDTDTDGDGLSDFRERTKYCTDPERADSDGDGKPDGDPDERREYTYTVRVLIDVLKPCTPEFLEDDYQDVHIVEEGKDYYRFEFVVYPLNTVADTIVADPEWRKRAKSMAEWTRPGPTNDHNAVLTAELTEFLAHKGMNARSADDKSLVEFASRELCMHARSVDGFTTFFFEHRNGRFLIPDALKGRAAKELAKAGVKDIETQFRREISAKGMFESNVRGSCTSSAIYLNGCLRSLGVPTRTILCVPIIDVTDPKEHEILEKGITHHVIRRIVKKGTEAIGQGWTSHTFNEVFIGGRWRRLNYDRLGQNVLDESTFGMMLHVLTVSDWADAKAAATIGLRQGLGRYDDRFGGPNPYSTLEIDDRFGEHAKIQNPEQRQFETMTIERVMWSNAQGSSFAKDFSPPVLLAHVKEWDGFDPLKDFTQRVDNRFDLIADGGPAITLQSSAGGITNQSGSTRWVILGAGQGGIKAMREGVEYKLVPRNERQGARWIVDESISVRRP